MNSTTSPPYARLSCVRSAGLFAFLCTTLLLNSTASGQSPQPTAPATSVVLLGTGGGPIGRTDRAGIASLLEVDGAAYLVDAGEGVVRQLAAVGRRPEEIGTVFLTHLHDDHTAGLPGLISFAWTRAAKPMTLIGPPRTQALLDGLLAFMAPNVEIRTAENPRRKSPTPLYSAKEVSPGLVYRDSNVRVTAIENSHYDVGASTKAGSRSYSFRFETRDKVVVFTGDSGPSQRLAEFAAGADVLVCEMASLADTRAIPAEHRAHMLLEHLAPAEVGRLAAAAKVRRLLLSHIGEVGPGDLAEIGRFYDGPIVIGADGQRW